MKSAESRGARRRLLPRDASPARIPCSTGGRPAWKRGRSRAGKEEERVGRCVSCQAPAAGPAAQAAAGLCAHRGAGAPALPSTMILWLCLCWGFSPSAGQPDSELMARYLEEQLLADYSIAEQVGFKAVVVREQQVDAAGLSPLHQQRCHAGQSDKNAFIPPVPTAQLRGRC